MVVTCACLYIVTFLWTPYQVFPCQMAMHFVWFWAHMSTCRTHLLGVQGVGCSHICRGRLVWETVGDTRGSLLLSEYRWKEFAVLTDKSNHIHGGLLGAPPPTGTIEMSLLCVDYSGNCILSNNRRSSVLYAKVAIRLRLLGNAFYVACLPLLCQRSAWLNGKSIWLVFRRSWFWIPAGSWIFSVDLFLTLSTKTSSFMTVTYSKKHQASECSHIL